MRDFYFEPTMRFELTTSSLPRKRSTPELSRLGKKNHIPLIWNVIFLERKTGVEPATFSLEGWRSTNWATSAICVYKLLLVNGVQIYKIFLNLQIKFIKKWGEQDSNLRSRKTAELQSDPFGHSGISPLVFYKLWASRGIRTHDPEITNHVLWPTELWRQNLRFQKNCYSLFASANIIQFFWNPQIFFKKFLIIFLCHFFFLD